MQTEKSNKKLYDIKTPLKLLPQITTINILFNKDYLIESCFLYLINIPHIFLYILFLGKSFMSCVKTTHLLNYESSIYTYWIFWYIILQDIYFTCLTLSTGIPMESLYIYINTTAHKLITMGNHFCTSRIKEKKNSYMFQTKYLN